MLNYIYLWRERHQYAGGVRKKSPSMVDSLTSCTAGGVPEVSTSTYVPHSRLTINFLPAKPNPCLGLQSSMTTTCPTSQWSWGLISLLPVASCDRQSLAGSIEISSCENNPTLGRITFCRVVLRTIEISCEAATRRLSHGISSKASCRVPLLLHSQHSPNVVTTMQKWY